MSVKAMSWALYDVKDLKPATRLVLAVLADHSSHDGTGAFPSAKTIGEVLGMDRRNVMPHLKALEVAGLIKRGDQRHVQHIPPQWRPVVYDLCLEASQRLAGVMQASHLVTYPASQQDAYPASRLGVMKSDSRCDASDISSITQTFKPKDKPLAAVQCRECGVARPEHLLSDSGLCTNCLPVSPGPSPDAGTGRAAVVAMLAHRRTPHPNTHTTTTESQ